MNFKILNVNNIFLYNLCKKRFNKSTKFAPQSPLESPCNSTKGPSYSFP